ncbi:hypothetical protein [Paenibacillus amylolyticus]|uniref:hypothetical protein n=1 Tax=Paenibacillus amylolyticus TaxID=1451 RepID=UPI00201D6243|nr:hypothetical protein [Paenibacillus amylolyticus]MCL6661759.1 hypothetical protein [Paenibacillus amylolyticus]
MNITYEGEANIKFPSTNLPSNNPKIKSIIAKAEGGKIEFIFNTDYETEAEALHATNKEVMKIEKMIFYSFGEEVRNLDWKVREVINQDGGKDAFFNGSADRVCSITVQRKYDLADMQGLVSNLQNIQSESSIYNLFIEIRKMKDKMGSFIMLYSLLIIYVGPQQPKIDKFIKRKYPSVRMEKTTKEGKEYKETIFTFLRNQLGHLKISSDTNVKKIHQEIDDYYERLSDLVKQMLVEKGLI